MKELETGVFDLESPIPFDIPAEAIEKMLVVYGKGTSQGIAAAILGYSAHYRKWVGLTVSRILTSLVNFDAGRIGLTRADTARTQQLSIETGKKLISVINDGINGKRKWLKEVGHNPESQNDKIITLVVHVEKSELRPQNQERIIRGVSTPLACPACKGGLPPLLKTKFCSYCGEPVPIEIQFKQVLNYEENAVSLKMAGMGIDDTTRCSEKTHAEKAALARKYVTYLERVSRAARKKGGLTYKKVAGIWHELFGVAFPFRFTSRNSKTISEQGARELVAKQMIRFCCDCGTRLTGI